MNRPIVLLLEGTCQGSMKKSKLDDGVKHTCGGEGRSHGEHETSGGCGCSH